MGRLDPTAGSRVAARVAAYAGLEPPEWVLRARVASRAAALGLDEAAYAARVAGDGDAAGDDEELASLVEVLRNGETRFYRHPGPLGLLQRELGAAVAGGLERVRGWSAGCATGEEAYTLAMLLAESGATDWEVLGTDLSQAALAQAEAAWYPAARAAALPAAWRARWLVTDGEGVRVAPEIRRRVRFERRNLALRQPRRGWDVVLCCNVLVHFATAAHEVVLKEIEESVAEGGFLLLGNGELGRRLAPLRDPSGHVIWRRTPGMTTATPVVVPAVPERHTPLVMPAVPERSTPVVMPAVPERHTPVVVPSLPERRTPVVVTSVSWEALEASEPAADAGVVRLSGSYGGGARLAGELRAALAGSLRAVDLDGAELLDEEDARVLLRLVEATDGRVELRATRPPVRHFMTRHGLSR